MIFIKSNNYQKKCNFYFSIVKNVYYIIILKKAYIPI